MNEQKDLMKKQFLNPAAWGMAVNNTNNKWLAIMDQTRFKDIKKEEKHIVPYGDMDLYYAAIDREHNNNEELIKRKQDEYKAHNLLVDEELANLKKEIDDEHKREVANEVTEAQKDSVSDDIYS